MPDLMPEQPVVDVAGDRRLVHRKRLQRGLHIVGATAGDYIYIAGAKAGDIVGVRLVT